MLFVLGMGRLVETGLSNLRVAAVLLMGAGVTACHTDPSCIGNGCAWSTVDWAHLQSLSFTADTVIPPDPTNSHWNDQDAGAALGQKFYFDPRFSGVTTLKDAIGRPVASARTPLDAAANVSCASCHDPAHAGTDITSVPNTLSIGAGIYDVNGQQTLNAFFYPLLYWNGRSDSLWSQALAVNTSVFSMNGTRQQTFWTIMQYYLGPYQAAFPTDKLPSTITKATFGEPAIGQAASANKSIGDQVFVNFGKAIEAYEYRLVSRDSAFDRFVRDGPGSGWISPAAELGARLFVGKASCIDCHNGPMLSDGKFHNIGVPQSGEHVPTVADCPPGGTCDCTPGNEKASCAPSGAWAGELKLTEAPDASTTEFRRDSKWSDSRDGVEPYATTRIAVDAGAARDPSLKGAWRTPSLRDVAITAPYMHDGYYQTLTEVVQHYNMGGVPSAAAAFQLPVCGEADAAPPGCTPADAGLSAPHLAVQIKPLDLSDDEVSDLVAFLGTLTGAPLPADIAKPPLLPDASAVFDGGVVPNPIGVSQAGGATQLDAGGTSQ
jgi:cytochrome c peroxidase